MDEQVLRGMAKWPNVPAVYGWLALDCRGKWLLQGEPIGNPTVTAYIARNYEVVYQAGRIQVWMTQSSRGVH